MKILGALVFYFVALVGTTAMAGEKNGEQTDFAFSNNEFAFNLFSKLKEKGKNLFFSPYSIRTALSMTYAGARNKTARQMAEVMRFGKQGIHRLNSSLAEDLEGIEGVDLLLANSLWGQKGVSFVSDFLRICQKYYGSRLFRVDFHKAAEQARRTINSWVEKKTKQRIKNLIPVGGVDELTSLVLTNAVYFKGDWASQFETSRTSQQPFFTQADTKVDVAMMHQVGRYAYAKQAGMEMIELPYKGQRLSMLVVLPIEHLGLQKIEHVLNADALRDLMKAASLKQVRLSLPMFELNWGTKDILNVLADLGMKDATGVNADFSGMSTQEKLFIGAVFHKAFCKVNEKGSEAAASTAVVMKRGGPPQFENFRADHPFLFFIKDNQTSAILFMGRVLNPTAK